MVDEPGFAQRSLLDLVLMGSRCKVTLRACLHYLNDEEWESLVEVVGQAVRSGRFYVSIGRNLIERIEHDRSRKIEDVA